MLQKSLLARLGLLVVGFVVGAVVSITLLQAVLRELDTASSQAQSMLSAVQDVSAKAAGLETSVESAFPTENNSVPYARGAEAVLAGVARLGEHPFVKENEELSQSFVRLSETARGVDAVASRSMLQTQRPALLAEVRRLRDEVGIISTLSRAHMADKQSTLSGHLRSLIIGLTIAALVMTNIAIIVLIRTANMILRPVGQLIEGSRELAHERFDHRIQIPQKGEFAELAAAYNSLADQLATNEQRKVKALQQLAVTLNHELINALTAIELQVTLVNRRAAADPQMGTHLGNIRTNLSRMAQTISSLRNVRRVVLTDYLPGEPMLDLPRSTAADDASATPFAAPSHAPTVSAPTVSAPRG